MNAVSKDGEVDWKKSFFAAIRERDEALANSQWVEVDSHKEIPEGQWLVEVEKSSHGLTLHTATIKQNLSIIGGLFAFDQYRAIRYCRLPITVVNRLSPGKSDE